MLVKMKYAPVHPSDMNVLVKNFALHYSVKNDILPTKIGNEGAGVVEKTGSKVKHFKVSCWTYDIHVFEFIKSNI